jgi:TolB protein
MSNELCDQNVKKIENMMIRNRILLFITVLLISISINACLPQPETSSGETEEQDPGIIIHTKTPKVWATIAPDNVATASPTPSARPISVQLQGRIAFQSDRDGSLEIYVMNADGSAVSRLTNNPAVDVFPAWSTKGEKIAFTSDRNGYPDIFIINPDGTDLTKLTNTTANDALPSWSPDDETIAFVSDRDGNDEIYTIRIDGTNPIRLTNVPAQDLFPDWSPDGEWIVFTSTRDVNSEIYKMRKDGTELIRLTDDPAADSNPIWSPDGSRIAFISRRDGFANLFLMNTDGSDLIQLTHYKSIVEVPSWSPDSQAIAFASDMEGNRDIFVISAYGSGLNRLTDLPQEDFYPSWSPQISYLEAALIEPTAATEGVCVNSEESNYGFSTDNPIKIGFDPRSEGKEESDCLPWLLGPQGQPIRTHLLDEIRVNESKLCMVSVTYEGQENDDIMYFDVFNYEQPKAPQGYICGSPVEYLKAVTAAKY